VVNEDKTVKKITALFDTQVPNTYMLMATIVLLQPPK
jgi:hypothetical protein